MDREARLRGVRRLLFVILLLGFLGTLAELFLLEHDEDAWQLIPIALLSSGVIALACTAAWPRPATVRLFQALMVLFIASGGAGLLLHYRANVEFQLEMDPALRSMALFWKVMAAKAPPALAPGIMAQLALVGLAYTYAHPARLAHGGTHEGER